MKVSEIFSILTFTRQWTRNKGPSIFKTHILGYRCTPSAKNWVNVQLHAKLWASSSQQQYYTLTHPITPASPYSVPCQASHKNVYIISHAETNTKKQISYINPFTAQPVKFLHRFLQGSHQLFKPKFTNFQHYCFFLLKIQQPNLIDYSLLQLQFDPCGACMPLTSVYMLNYWHLPFQDYNLQKRIILLRFCCCPSNYIASSSRFYIWGQFCWINFESPDWNVLIVDIHLWTLLWAYCPRHSGVNWNDQANRLRSKATLTSGLHLRKSEVLRSLRHYLQAQSQWHCRHTINHQSPGGERHEKKC